MRILFFGWNGYIGEQLVNLLKDHTILKPVCRLGDLGLEQEIADSACDCIINSAGLTGKPNVDWCETHKDEVKKINLDAAIELAGLAKKYNKYHVLITTGCVFRYNGMHPNHPETTGFTEEDEPNFSGSYYSQTKLSLEKWVRQHTDSLVVRLRMPIDGKLPLNPRNLLAKITTYNKLVVDAWQSVSVLGDLLPILVEQIRMNTTGVYNYVNPGPVALPDILACLPDQRNRVYEPISFSDLITLAPRSWCILSSRKLSEWCVAHSIPPPLDAKIAILESVERGERQFSI